MSDLGGGIDEFQFNLFHIFVFMMRDQWPPENNWPLPATHARTFDDEKFVLDFTVVGESTEWGDGLFGEIDGGGSLVFDDLAGFVLGVAFSDAVDLLVNLNPMVITFLSTPSNSITDPRWMPSTDTSDLPQTTMSFPRQFFGSPTGSYTLATFTFGDSDSVNIFRIGKDGSDWNRFFKQGASEIDFVGNRFSTVDLKFQKMSFLLFQRKEFHLGVSDETDGGTVFFHLVEISFDGSWIGFPTFGSFGESFFLGVGVVAVETAFDLSGEGLGPDGLEGAEAAGGFDVSNNTDTNHWWGLQDGNWFNNFLLVQFGTVPLDFPDNVGHTSFITDESGQVAIFVFAVFGMGLDPSEMTAGAFPWEKSLGTVPGGLEFSVRHEFSVSST